MMKKYIYAIAMMLMATVAESMAQQREFPALQINFKDGTSELVAYPISGYRYGVENPKDGDYITCSLERCNFTDAIPGNWIPKYSLTKFGVEAQQFCERTGLIFSDEPIDTTGLDVTRMGVLCTIINGSEIAYNSGFWSPEELFANSVSQELGKVHYGLAYYVLDGHTYYSEQVEQRIPKQLADVLKRKGVSYLYIDDKNAAIMDSKKVQEQLYAHYGVTSSLCIDDLVSMKEKEFVNTLTAESAKQYATEIDTCDDGNIYHVSLPESYAQDIIAYIEQESNTPFYVKATPETAIYTYSSSNIKREFTTALPSGIGLTMVDCEESWGVKDNQYLHSNVPTTSNYSPAIALKLNHLMLPGKKYNVTFNLAPQTDAASVDTLDLQFYVLMADGQDEDNVNDTYPRHVATPKATSKYFVRNAADDSFTFVGYADKVTSCTFEYTPERLVFNYAFKVMNQFNTMLSTTKKKYGQNIRLIGVEVVPAE